MLYSEPCNFRWEDDPKTAGKYIYVCTVCRYIASISYTQPGQTPTPTAGNCQGSSHTYGNWIQNGNTHYKKCIICGNIYYGENYGAHTFVNGICSICGYSKNPTQSPTPTATQNSTPTPVNTCAHDWAYLEGGSGKHTKICRKNCGIKAETENCYGGKWQRENDGHYKICEACNCEYNQGKHIDTDNDGVCDVCGYVGSNMSTSTPTSSPTPTYNSTPTQTTGTVECPKSPNGFHKYKLYDIDTYALKCEYCGAIMKQ